jgi:hypothetical protein
MKTSARIAPGLWMCARLWTDKNHGSNAPKRVKYVPLLYNSEKGWENTSLILQDGTSSALPEQHSM